MPGWRDEGVPEHAPTRAELDREEHEDMMRATYETRYREFCRAWRLDPEDGESVHIYELEWEEEEHEGGWPPDPGG